MFQDVMCLGQDVMCTDERMCIRSRNSVCSACSGTVCASADALLLQGTRPRCTGPSVRATVQKEAKKGKKTKKRKGPWRQQSRN